MALPGPVTSTMSQTPHRLIRDGQAVLVTDSRDVKELLAPIGEVPESPRRGPDTPFDRLPEDLQTVRECLDPGEEIGAAVVSRRTGLTLPVSMAALDELVEQGWLEDGDDGGYRLPTGQLRA